MKTYDVEQGTDEWHGLRLGKVTASNMDQIITSTGEKSKQADKYMNKIIGEQITGESAETFKGNAHTDRGHEWEGEAAQYYAMNNECTLTRVGFCTTDDGLLGCSPDYLIGDDGVLEIKTGLPHIMIEYYLSGKLEQEHRPQTQATLLITGRAQIVTMLYHPLMKPIILPTPRNLPYIVSMQTMLDEFHKKMAERISVLKSKGFMEAA